MPRKFAYVLEHFIKDQPTVVGVFTSLLRVKVFLRGLPKKYPYAIYKLPLNANLTKERTLDDQQGFFDHWHYGTNEVEFVEVAEDGTATDQGNRVEITWP